MFTNIYFTSMPDKWFDVPSDLKKVWVVPSYKKVEKDQASN